MLIEARCPNGHILHVREQYAGKIGACPRCGEPVRIPCLAATAAAASDRLSDQLGAPPSSTPSPPVVVVEVPPQDRHTWAPAANPSTHPGRGRACLECGRVISQSFAICPQCGMPVTVYRHLDVHREGDVAVIQIVKPQVIDDRMVKEVSDELSNVLSRVAKHHVVLNLSKVTGLSSSMLGTLVMLERRLAQRRRRLRLCNVNAEVRAVLIATKLHRVLPMADNEPDAIHAIQIEMQNEPPIDRED